MRKKILIFGACCLLAVGSLSGCGDKADDTKNAKTESTEKTDKKQTDKKADAKKEELKTIGTKAEGESVISVTLKNSTGKDITGIALKAGNLPEYGAGLMTEGDVFKNGESRILYYDTAAGGDAASYEVQVYFADQSHLALHTVNFGSFKESELCLEEEVVFLKYEDTTTKKVVSTKDAEISVKEAQAAAQAQAEAEAQAAAEAAAAAQAQSEAEAWAQQQQWTDPAPAPAPEPAPAPQPGGGGGCLNDGLVQ